MLFSLQYLLILDKGFLFFRIDAERVEMALEKPVVMRQRVFEGLFIAEVGSRWIIRSLLVSRSIFLV